MVYIEYGSTEFSLFPERIHSEAADQVMSMPVPYQESLVRVDFDEKTVRLHFSLVKMAENDITKDEVSRRVNGYFGMMCYPAVVMFIP